MAPSAALRIIIFLSLFLIPRFSTAQSVHNLHIKFNSIKEESGSLYIQILDKSEKVISSHIIDAKEGAILKVGNLKDGQYWVRVYQDLNGNGSLDKNYLGIPKEPYGFSNNVRPKFGPPDTEDLLFDLRQNTSIAIQLQ
jgi:uncharacterized protein (DUF2141 family)